MYKIPKTNSLSCSTPDEYRKVISDLNMIIFHLNNERENFIISNLKLFINEIYSDEKANIGIMFYDVTNEIIWEFSDEETLLIFENHTDLKDTLFYTILKLKIWLET